MTAHEETRWLSVCLQILKGAIALTGLFAFLNFTKLSFTSPSPTQVSDYQGVKLCQLFKFTGACHEMIVWDAMSKIK